MGQKEETKRVVRTGKKEGTTRVVQTGQKEGTKRVVHTGKTWLNRTVLTASFLPKKEIAVVKNDPFLTGIFYTPVKKLNSGLRNYPQVTFNKRLEGYQTVPSAGPFYVHALYIYSGAVLQFLQFSSSCIFTVYSFLSLKAQRKYA